MALYRKLGGAATTARGQIRDSLVHRLVHRQELVHRWSTGPSEGVACRFVDPLSTAFLLVETGPSGVPYWSVKWRAADGSRLKRRLGAEAWVERSQKGWTTRPGRSRDGALTERQAKRFVPDVIHAHQAAAFAARDVAAGRALEAARAAEPTFRVLIEQWLRYLADVKDIKPSTLRTYRYMLAEPGTRFARGQGESKGRIMAALGDRRPVDLDTADVAAVLTQIAGDGVSRATVNRYREVIVAAFNFALRPEQRRTWGLVENPAVGAPKRRTDPPGRLEVFTVEQVEAVARAAAAGGWRTTRPYDTPAVEAALHEQDAQLGELVRIAAYTGLRRGELVALRWGDVRWGDRVLVVERAVSDRVERSTKGRCVRFVPLGDQALAALDRLSQRPNFIRPDDYIFGNEVGDRLDASALRRRFIAARDAAGVPPLRFHDLRHTAGTLLSRVLDPATVKDVLGHADLKTTERYLHAVRASRLSDAATRAFAPSAVDERELVNP